VGRPVHALKCATEHITEGDLGYQIDVQSSDEIGELAASFNHMSTRLKNEHNENVAWTQTLEKRVEQKTRELKRAHEHALHTEKMASIGKMAAVLAHEINNPLSGILTYAKLLRKWIGHEDGGGSRRQDICDSLDLIASESRRCGDLVKNLLTFSRTTPMNLQPTNLNQVVDRALRLVQHQLDLAGVHVQPELDPDLPPVLCDSAQIEQVLLALMVNAADAMPQGGNLWIRSNLKPEENAVRIVVRDDGAGIPPDILPRLFEPFLTTKETGKGVGLGLAISRSILERHNGTIEVQSEPGRGTTFTITLPWEAEIENHAPKEITAAVGGR
jgi:two-component system NtrC family sensor kinase